MVEKVDIFNIFSNKENFFFKYELKTKASKKARDEGMKN